MRGSSFFSTYSEVADVQSCQWQHFANRLRFDRITAISCGLRLDDWVKKCMEYEAEEDQRWPGERLSKSSVKHINWTKRILWIVVNGEVDKGCPMIRMGVREWMFSPGQRAVKRLFVCELWSHVFGPPCSLQRNCHSKPRNVMLTMQWNVNDYQYQYTE